MIVFRIGGLSLKIDFSFFAVVALYMFFDAAFYGILGLLACFCHEAGHILIMLIKREKISELMFCGGGLKITGKEREASALVLCGGCAVNLLLFVIGSFFFGAENEHALVFAYINLFVGAFNILPIHTLDGGQLLEKALIRIYSAEKAVKISDIAELVGISVIFFVLIMLCFMKIVGISAFAMIFYLILIDIFAKM